jgi:hypothetical protein
MPVRAISTFFRFIRQSSHGFLVPKLQFGNASILETPFLSSQIMVREETVLDFCFAPKARYSFVAWGNAPGIRVIAKP